jgi:hypothetical protein
VTERCQVDPLAKLHLAGFRRLGMIVAQEMQDAMDDQERELGIDRTGVVGGLLGRDLGAHDDVADHRRAATDRVERVGIEREREHIGRSLVTHVFGIEPADGDRIDEMEIDPAGRDTLGLQDIDDEPAEWFEWDRHIVLGVVRLGSAVSSLVDCIGTIELGGQRRASSCRV